VSTEFRPERPEDAIRRALERLEVGREQVEGFPPTRETALAALDELVAKAAERDRANDDVAELNRYIDSVLRPKCDRYREALEAAGDLAYGWTRPMSDKERLAAICRVVEAALAADRDPAPPDPGSFGGHPYTPDEIALGYGTDHDPRFPAAPVQETVSAVPDPVADSSLSPRPEHTFGLLHVPSGNFLYFYTTREAADDDRDGADADEFVIVEFDAEGMPV